MKINFNLSNHTHMNKLSKFYFLIYALKSILIFSFCIIGWTISKIILDDFFATPYPTSTQWISDSESLTMHFATKYASQPSNMIYYIIGVVVVILILVFLIFLIMKFLKANKEVLDKYSKNFIASLILGLMMSISASIYFFSQTYLQVSLFLIATITTFFLRADREKTKKYAFRVSLVNGVIFSIAGLPAVAEWFLEIERGVMGQICGGSPAGFCAMLQLFQMIFWTVGLFIYFMFITFIIQLLKRLFK